MASNDRDWAPDSKYLYRINIASIFVELWQNFVFLNS